MTEDPEIRAKVLEWQSRHNIVEGDPALALIELLDLYYRKQPPVVVAPTESASAALPIVDEAFQESLRRSLLPAIDRLTYQSQELQQRLDELKLDDTVKQIATYYEGIDYCTKKLDVYKKDSESLVVRVGKIAGQVNPVARGAVLVLMLVSGVIGYVVAVVMGH